LSKNSVTLRFIVCMRILFLPLHPRRSVPQYHLGREIFPPLTTTWSKPLRADVLYHVKSPSHELRTPLDVPLFISEGFTLSKRRVYLVFFLPPLSQIDPMKFTTLLHLPGVLEILFFRKFFSTVSRTKPPLGHEFRLFPSWPSDKLSAVFLSLVGKRPYKGRVTSPSVQHEGE